MLCSRQEHKISAQARGTPSPTMPLSLATTGCRGLISKKRLAFIYACFSASPKACARMMRSMLALHPYLDVTTMHGVVLSRCDSLTSTLRSPIASVHHLLKSLNASLSALILLLSFLPAIFRSSLDALANSRSSYSLRLFIMYSSRGSVK